MGGACFVSGEEDQVAGFKLALAQGHTFQKLSISGPGQLRTPLPEHVLDITGTIKAPRRGPAKIIGYAFISGCRAQNIPGLNLLDARLIKNAPAQGFVGFFIQFAVGFKLGMSLEFFQLPGHLFRKMSLLIFYLVA